MNPFFNYFSRIFTAVKNLLGGMKVTWKELWTKKVTMEYPENRETLVISERWRSELIMPHDANNEHACTACGICMTNCPNGTITVTSQMVETEDGKKKKVLDKHIWDYGMCTFCNLCVITCPSDAIIFNNDFEGAMFDRSKLVHQINMPGSKLREKKVAPKPAAPKPAAPTETPKVTEATDAPKAAEKASTDSEATKTQEPISAKTSETVEAPKQSKEDTTPATKSDDKAKTE